MGSASVAQQMNNTLIALVLLALLR